MCVYFDSANASCDKTDGFQRIALASTGDDEGKKTQPQFIVHLVRYFIGFDYVQCARIQHHFAFTMRVLVVCCCRTKHLRRSCWELTSDAQYLRWRFVYCNRVPLKLKYKFDMNTWQYLILWILMPFLPVHQLCKQTFSFARLLPSFHLISVTFFVCPFAFGVRF